MTVLLVGAISLGVVFLLGSIGETITEKAGNLNLGIPGIMCMGTAGGCFGASIYMSSLASNDQAVWILLILSCIAFSALFSAVGGLIYAFLTVSLRSNQNVTGLALTIFGTGFTQFFIDTFVNRLSLPYASKIIKTPLPIIGQLNLGWFSEIFLNHGFFVYFAIAIAIISAVILNKTKVGLNLRAIGENPSTADATGINVTKYKYIAIILGSIIAGFGGMFYIMDYIGGSWENASTIQGFGWLAIALVIFTVWKPDLSILGSIIFGALYIAPSIITGIDFSQMKLFKLLPYVVTVIVLIITSIINKKENQPPASLGVNYFREER